MLNDYLQQNNKDQQLRCAGDPCHSVHQDRHNTLLHGLPDEVVLELYYQPALDVLSIQYKNFAFRCPLGISECEFVRIFFSWSVPSISFERDAMACPHSLSDIPQMPSKTVEFVPPFHRQGNGIPSAAIRGPDFGDRSSFGRPFAQIFRHSDTPLLSFSPGRRFPRPTPERVFVVDHQSGSGFSQTSFSARQLRPIGT